MSINYSISLQGINIKGLPNMTAAPAGQPHTNHSIPGMRRDNSGTTETRTIRTINNWSLPDEAAREFQELSADVARIQPRPLEDEDIQLVEGKSYRGTDLLMAVSSLYKANGVSSFFYSPSGIDLKQTLATPEKDTAAKSYANKYISGRQTFQKQETPIYQRLQADNGVEPTPMPEGFVQPVLVGYNQPIYQAPEHKEFEGIVHNTTPNVSTLKHISGLLGYAPEDFSEKYPILSSKFKD